MSGRELRVGDRVCVSGTDEEGRITAVHPDSQVEVEFFHAGGKTPHRKRYAAEALEIVE